ncbi:TPA: LOW QUALITY PROTEIN: hypothetical protein N0F65_011013 [Lagenidium giganteum]|uniref:Uncharacterized protein n=1 Tax=Lagenidium giganteum TaxID=4803 RepID=A0AAV2Z883_9STRA|nr:TPA: LOW QUALITY PROTEIN: hypothetical protein N0F65_011013 [Lagenidium giganteum]
MCDAVDDDARMMLSRYLALIKEFLQRKQLALTASSAGSTRRSTRSSTNGGLFQVIERVCDDRIRQLERQAAAPFSHSRSGGRARMVEPRVVVAEALVQELLTSLTYLSLEEREQLVLDEVERVEDLRRLHMDLVREEQYLSSQVNAATGEARRLHELQAMLREEFLQEYQDQHSAMTTTTAARMEETLEQKEASLQFAWETIREQKNEIVRLRAMVQHYEERQPTQQCNSTPGLADSCMDPTLISRGSTSLQPQEPAKAINKLLIIETTSTSCKTILSDLKMP